ncbi:MAG: PEGA domain-containing protein [Gallionella sp.]|nr:PEGA domain-containing protein [Gallionella sp.]
MSRLLRHAALLVLLSAVAGCSTIKDSAQSAKNTVGGWFGGDNAATTLNTTTNKNAAMEKNTGPLVKYGATLRVNKFVDQRKVSNPRLLGQIDKTTPVAGISGTELIMDQDVSAIVTGAIKKHFDAEGFLVMEGSSASNALFEVTGVIKELTLNVKERDSINIAIETTLKDVETGKVVWSGLVMEKNDRFAGVSGNSKDDVVEYLNRELRIVTTKTVEAIGASLMVSRSELFNLTPGTKPIPGVTVYVAPTVAKPAPAAPSATYGAQPGSAMPAPAYTPQASATAGLLQVNTNPARAKVYLDGVYYGMSPLRMEMEPGVHAISVKLEGYKMVTEKVSIRRGDNTEIELNLER